MESADVTIGHLVVHIGEACGAVLREAAAHERSHFRARPTPILLQPSLIRDLVDRRGELAAAVSALDAGGPLEISGPPGVGKTALLRHLAHHPRAALVDGTLFIEARHQSSIDLLQRIFDAFYATDTPCRPTRADVRRGMQDRHALILLDEVGLSTHELEELFEAAPRCAFVATTRERTLWGEARSIALTGLPPEDAIAFLERELERALDPEEREAAVRLGAALNGHPVRLRQAAELIRASIVSGDSWIDHLASDTLIVELLTRADEKERRLLTALAPWTSVPIQIQHVAELAGLTDVEPDLIALARRGLIARHQSRYRLVDGVSDRLRRTEDLKPSINRAVTYFTAWADRQRRNQDSLLDTADALIRVQQYAIEERRWGEALRLGRQLEPPLVLAGRWGAWETVLDRCLTAAKAIGDRSVEAWVLHQQGTRSVYLDDVDAARRALDQAARLRDDLGETAAASVSRRNLSFIVATLPVTVPKQRAPQPFDDAGDDPLPVRVPAAAQRSRSSMGEVGALIITFLLFAALGGFVYIAISAKASIARERERSSGDGTSSNARSGDGRSGDGRSGNGRSDNGRSDRTAADSAASIAGAAPQPATLPDVSAATTADPGSQQRASIRIFTARPGSIATRRRTDLCYAVSDSVQTRIEPTLGDVDAADTLTCRTVAPSRTTTYELTAVGRDGIPVSEHLVVVVR
jgi:hypothetical protein